MSAICCRSSKRRLVAIAVQGGVSIKTKAPFFSRRHGDRSRAFCSRSDCGAISFRGQQGASEKASSGNKDELVRSPRALLPADQWSGLDKCQLAAAGPCWQFMYALVGLVCVYVNRLWSERCPLEHVSLEIVPARARRQNYAVVRPARNSSSYATTAHAGSDRRTSYAFPLDRWRPRGLVHPRQFRFEM